MEASSWSQFRS